MVRVRLLSSGGVRAHRIAVTAPRAVRGAREAVLRGLDLPLGDALRLEQDLADPLRDSPENREARARFGKPRPPSSSGAPP